MVHSQSRLAVTLVIGTCKNSMQLFLYGFVCKENCFFFLLGINFPAEHYRNILWEWRFVCPFWWVLNEFCLQGKAHKFHKCFQRRDLVLCCALNPEGLLLLLSPRQLLRKEVANLEMKLVFTLVKRRSFHVSKYLVFRFLHW